MSTMHVRSPHDAPGRAERESQGAARRAGAVVSTFDGLRPPPALSLAARIARTLAGLPVPYPDPEVLRLDAAAPRAFDGWLQALHRALLGRAPGDDELERAAQQLGEAVAVRGQSLFAAGAEQVEALKQRAAGAGRFEAQVRALYSDLLGREPNGSELEAGCARAAMGEPGLAALDEGLRREPEYSRYIRNHPFAPFINNMFHTGLGRSALPVERLECEQHIGLALTRGESIIQAGADCVAALKQRPEYDTLHPAHPWLEATYAARLGRPATLEEINVGEARLVKLRLGGKPLGEAYALLEAAIGARDTRGPRPGASSTET